MQKRKSTLVYIQKYTIYKEVWEWQQLCFGGIAERKYAEEEAMPRIRDSLMWVERRLGMDLGAARPRLVQARLIR